MKLKTLIRGHVLGKDIQFFGFVSEEKKYELLAKAHILLIPSVHEGWGLTAVESASQGTPVIGYDIPGLRDSVENGRTGILTKPIPKDLAKSAIELIENKKEYKHLQTGCVAAAKKLNWADSVDKSLKIINSI